MQKNTLDIDLSGKVAVVTGAGGVLCSDIARALARVGARVALLNRTAAKAQVHAGAINAAGGVAGFMNSNTTLEACSSTGSVTATGTGDVSATGYNVGGVAGFSMGIITACYHAGDTVSGSARVGGVLGYNQSGPAASGTVTACYWKNDQEQGIGNDQTGTGETTKVEGNWTDAVAQMNEALSGTGYSYQQGNPPTLN